ncbi:unnamed protein product [Protopolystoma xenopodis]|uniref:Uncharacterized protein n=1 Tax=Protopolystoma xenopodis TaxID=117903 RepID=A0A3S4ZWZ7_9PLAT|nr:unnamed protein product [Protopolystoma xenopodis]
MNRHIGLQRHSLLEDPASSGFCPAGLNSNGNSRRMNPLRLDSSPYPAIPYHALASYVATYHADDDAGYQAEFEVLFCT